MKHKHLTLQDRYYIEISIKNGDSQTTIAKALNRSQGTISKEIKKNTGIEDIGTNKPIDLHYKGIKINQNLISLQMRSLSLLKINFVEFKAPQNK